MIDADDVCSNSSGKFWIDPMMKQDYVVNVVFACVCGLFIPFMLFVGIRVFQITKWNEKVILLVILFLNLELVFKVLFYTMNTFQDLDNHCTTLEELD